MERPPKPDNSKMSGTRTKPIPLAYLITFTCYGTRLHGHDAGSVDRDHNVYGTPALPANLKRVASEEGRARGQPYKLNGARRPAVLAAIQALCSHRGWNLLAAHVRTQHVHLVVGAEESPEKILHDVKAYASRALNHACLDETKDQRWALHGSTRYLWKPEQVGAAIHYVVREQGEPMAVWERAETLG
jgi:REP element-mobilizing transposase RayT